MKKKVISGNIERNNRKNPAGDFSAIYHAFLQITFIQFSFIILKKKNTSLIFFSQSFYLTIVMVEF